MSLYPRIVKTDPDVLVRRLDTDQWYVDGSNGDDGHDGDRPEKPLATFLEAVDRCTNGHMDVINAVAPGHVTEANPIVLDKQFITVRGWPSQNPGGQSPCTLVATVDAAYFTIAAQDVVVKDFTIHGGASYPTIDFNEVAWSFRTGIHNVTFKAGTWGIAMANAAGGFQQDKPSHGWAITECKFLPALSAGGILLASNGSWGLIADNFFEYAPYAIYGHLNCQSTGVQVLRNRIMCPSDDVVGRGIYVGTQATRWIVADNYAGDASTTAMTFNPFFDQANASSWFNNYINNDVAGTPDDPD